MLLSTLISMKKSGFCGNGRSVRQGNDDILRASLRRFSPSPIPWLQPLLGLPETSFLSVSRLSFIRYAIPKKLRAEAIAALSAKKKEKKAVKTVKVKAEDGSLTEKKVTGMELDKLRLQKARELDNERYN